MSESIAPVTPYDGIVFSFGSTDDRYLLANRMTAIRSIIARCLIALVCVL
jgi:hypothetical protein